jgi:hypothetical protein
MVRLIKKNLLADAFLELVQQDDSLQEIPENAKPESVTGEALYAELVPGSTAPERELKDLLKQYVDLSKPNYHVYMV